MNSIEEQLNKEKLEEIKAVVSTITGYMVLPLYLIFWVTDLFYAPEYKWEFLFLRCLVIPFALLSNFLVNKTKTLFAAQNIGLAYIFGLAIIIDVMILLMAEPTSPYYTGLILIAIGGLGFFPWSRQYFIYVVAVIFVPYLIIVFSLNPGEKDIASLVVIGFFINGTVTVLWVVSFFREKLRLKEITARLKLKSEIEKRKSVEIDLTQARDEALKASKAKSIFLANMSHELRTPLNAIIGYGELLEDEVIDNGHHTYVDDLNKINTAGRHLLNLINDVLDLSRIEAGQMKILTEDIDLAVMMKTDESIFNSLVKKNHNTFSIHCPDDIGLLETDEIKLRQILYNLVSNAGKFTKNGKINLSITPLLIKEQQWLRFDVADDGIGMTPEQTYKVFDVFVQADSTTTKKFGGSGLGLSICWHFSHMLGGEIFLDSEVGHGTVFTILLPRYQTLYKEKFSHEELKEISLQKDSSYAFG